MIERFQHGDKIVAQDGLLLSGRRGVFVADAGEHGGDMAVLPVERLAALRVVPGQGRQPAVDRRHRLFVPLRCRGLGRDVKANNLWIWRQRIERLAPAPGAKMLPVGGVGATGVC